MKNQVLDFLTFCTWGKFPKPLFSPKVLFKKIAKLDKLKYEELEKMENLNDRNIRMTLRVSEKEFRIIQEKMKCAGTKNFSAFARKMLMDGVIIKHDYSSIRDLARELGNLSRNINQIVKRANETRTIYEQDLKDIQLEYGKVKAKISERLVKIINNEE